jgi:hypothetical protein
MNLWKMLEATEFWSAIAGAFVGGLIALALQYLSLREGRRERQEERKQRQKAHANALLFKMMRVHSNCLSIFKYIEEALATGINSESEVEAWEVVRGLANVPEAVHFSSDEMSTLLAMGDHDVFNRVIEQDTLHNSLLDTVRLYTRKREQLSERFADVCDLDTEAGAHLGGAVKIEDAKKIRPLMVEVNHLINDLRKSASMYSEESLSALGRLHKIFRDKLELPYTLEIKA